MHSASIAPLVLLALAPAASAQAINIDFETSAGTPTSPYGAAAGQPGLWNAVDTFGNPASLVDTAGAPTGVVFAWSGFHFGLSSNNPGTSGDDEALMDDFFDGPGTYTVSGLAPGNYDVYSYCWAADDNSAITNVAVPGSSNGPQNVGGPWPGGHALGVTYAKHSVAIASGETLSIVLTVGNGFASLNGLQLEPSTPPCPAPVTYCTAKVNSCGAMPVISSTGMSSASATSGFVISGSGARFPKPGLLIYSANGRNNAPFLGGTLCIAQPVRRSEATTAVRGSGGIMCDGRFQVDWNAFSSGALGGNPQGFLSQAGSQVNVQWWGRDSVQKGSYLSDGLEYTVCP